VPNEDAFDISILDRQECLALLAQVDVGRLGISIDALPVILPVHFTLDGESVVFRSVTGSKLDAATVDTVVAFQADRYEPEGLSGWSVLLQGVATTATDEATHRRAASVTIPRWTTPDGDHRLVRVMATTIHGRRFASER